MPDFNLFFVLLLVSSPNLRAGRRPTHLVRATGSLSRDHACWDQPRLPHHCAGAESEAACAGQQLGERTGGLPRWCSGRRRRVADLLHVGSGPLLDQYLASRGIMAWSADLVADDWRRINAQEIMARALVRLEQRGKGVLLLHDIHPATVLALPALLRE